VPSACAIKSSFTAPSNAAGSFQPLGAQSCCCISEQKSKTTEPWSSSNYFLKGFKRSCTQELGARPQSSNPPTVLFIKPCHHPRTECITVVQLLAQYYHREHPLARNLCELSPFPPSSCPLQNSLLSRLRKLLRMLGGSNC
jgi:hypothetical protein